MFRLTSGEVAEWSNAAVSKTVDPGNRVRGFESPPLRKKKPALSGRFFHAHAFTNL